MTADPFTHLVQVVTTVIPLERKQQQQASVDVSKRHTGKIKLVRAALDRGAHCAADLTKIAGLANSSIVYSLLKHDIKKGLVRYSDGLYEKVPK